MITKSKPRSRKVAVQWIDAAQKSSASSVACCGRQRAKQSSSFRFVQTDKQLRCELAVESQKVRGMPGCLGLRTISTSLAAIMAFNLTHVFRLVSGTRYCHDTMDCFLLPGYTCQGGRCICDPERDTGLFSCVPARMYGDKCRTDTDCHTGDVNLVCARVETRTCRCRRGFVWDVVSKRCYRIEDESYTTTKFDPVRDLIIPGIIVMTIGAMMYLGIKLFCNCGKLWQRGPRIDSPRELEECGVGAGQPTAWVASYRVFSSMERSPSSQFGAHSALHAAPCLLVPGPHQPSAPPPYEEALKHKVILSSYPAAMAGPLPPPPLPLPSHAPPALVHASQAATLHHTHLDTGASSSEQDVHAS